MASVETRTGELSSPRRRRSPRDNRDRDEEERDVDRRPRARQEGADTYRPSRDRDGDQSRSAPLPRRDRSPPVVAPVRTEEEKQAAAKAEYEKLLNMRSGGVYIPPARLRALQSQITDTTSKEYQRMAWEALKKSINGLINKVNVSNIKHIVPELFNENLVRGRGLFCVSILKAQSASLPFTPIYAAMAAIVNTKLPTVGELLVKRLVLRFRKAFRRNDKGVCLSSTTFIAHLVNQQVVHEMLAAQILLLLLQKPTDDSVEIAVGLTREVGQYLEEMSPAIAMAVFDQFRTILHEADIDKRVQYMIEVLFQTRKDKFKDNPAIKEELDLVEEEDQITHRVELDGEIDPQDGLNIFKFDDKYTENEEAYKKLKSEILGEGSDYESGDDSDESSEDEENEEEKAMQIKDLSNADLVNLRRTLYLTLMSSADPEEAVHKLMKVNLPAGQEPELVSMIVESCAQEKTYLKYYGLAGERFAKINRLWLNLFEESFVKYYDTIHRYDTNKLRNIARFWGHMLGSDALGWHVLSVIHLNEEETTSASRIFIKILFQEMAENMGMTKLSERLTKDTMLQPSLAGLFPHDNAKNLRFSINYFTSIGMGVLTEEMREFLQNMPKPALPPPPPQADGDDQSTYSSSRSSYSSYSSYTSDSRSRSRPRSISRARSPPRRRRQLDNDDRQRSTSRTPPPRRTDADIYRRGRSPTRSVVSRRSRSPLPRRTDVARRSRRTSYSRSPMRDRSRTPIARRGGPAERASSRSVSRARQYRRRNTSSVSARRPVPNDRRRASYSRSPPPSAHRTLPARRNSSSLSAEARRRRRYSSTSSRSPSRSASLSRSRSPSRTPSRSRSPPRRVAPSSRGRNGGGSYGRNRDDSRADDRRELVSPPTAGMKRRYESVRSRSRSRSPVPVRKRERMDS